MKPASEYTLTSGDVSKRLGVNIDTVARWSNDGKIPCAKTVGGYRRYRPEDVEAFAKTLEPEQAS